MQLHFFPCELTQAFSSLLDDITNKTNELAIAHNQILKLEAKLRKFNAVPVGNGDVIEELSPRKPAPRKPAPRKPAPAVGRRHVMTDFPSYSLGLRQERDYNRKRADTAGASKAALNKDSSSSHSSISSASTTSISSSPSNKTDSPTSSADSSISGSSSSSSTSQYLSSLDFPISSVVRSLLCTPPSSTPHPALPAASPLSSPPMSDNSASCSSSSSASSSADLTSPSLAAGLATESQASPPQGQFHMVFWELYVFVSISFPAVSLTDISFADTHELGEESDNELRQLLNSLEESDAKVVKHAPKPAISKGIY